MLFSVRVSVKQEAHAVCRSGTCDHSCVVCFHSWLGDKEVIVLVYYQREFINFQKLMFDMKNIQN